MSQVHLIYNAIARASNNSKDAHIQTIGPTPMTPRQRVEEIRNNRFILISVKVRDDFGGWRSIPNLDRSLHELDYLSESHVAISYLDGSVTKYTNQKTVVSDYIDFHHGRWMLYSRTSTRSALLHKRRVPMVWNKRVIALAQSYVPDIAPEIVDYVATQIGDIVHQVSHDQNRHLSSRSPETTTRESFEHIAPGLEWYIENCLFEDISPPKLEAVVTPPVEVARPQTVTKNYTATVIKKHRQVA